MSTTTIDPEQHIFGIAFGTTEDDFIKRVGKPDGYIQLGGDESAMIYGKEVAFLFHGKRLGGMHISHYVVGSDLGDRIAANDAFRDIASRWRLNNGIRAGTSAAKLKEIVNVNVNPDRPTFNPSYITRTASVKLHMTFGALEGASSGEVYGVTVEKTR